MDKEQVIALVRQYKEEISGLFSKVTVYLYGSYSKGTATDQSDIDVAVVVPSVGDDWLEKSAKLWHATLSVSTMIEPVLLEEEEPSPLYRDIMRTGIAV